MAKKRASGEGSITQRKDGLWQGSMYLPQPDGTKKRIFKYARTRKEIVGWLTEIRHDLKSGKPVWNTGMTLNDWLDHWFQTYCVDIRESTRMNYHTYIYRHVHEHSIGMIPLQKLTTDDLQEFINFLNQSGKLDNSGGVSPKTQRNIYNMLRQSLDQAVGNRLLWTNPADYVKLVKTEQKEITFLSLDEMQKLLDASRGDPYRIGLLVMLFGGLRLGECLALTQHDIKYDAELDCWYLDVHASVGRVTNFDAKENENRTVLRVSEPKTRSSRRQIPLLPEVVAELHRHMEMQRKLAKVSSGAYWKNPHLISGKDGGFIDPSTFRKWLRAIVLKAKLDEKRIHPHLLRHTFASQSLKCGLQLEEISKLLGHTDTSFTSRVYVHSDLEGRNAAICKLQSMAQNLI